MILLTVLSSLIIIMRAILLIVEKEPIKCSIAEYFMVPALTLASLIIMLIFEVDVVVPVFYIAVAVRLLLVLMRKIRKK
ncbi:MAG: hypothetical protein IJ499_06785 [Clostridia bacterium]|nr:hypothetical protein [Clostridia bacterium]